MFMVGGGPIGFITPYQLACNLPQSSHGINTIERHTKSSQIHYGRAITLFPRCSEMLDQFDSVDQLAQ
ncbi:hypothetical protein CC86DRAFT_370399 [Ophiobolus disseminans]|uniref:FAD-binding domain-containing protein n=1 Tax=Ophiobolus disseminans TaxID=1469910 RepID=A0A6A6ZZW9_9PLEO|nr:hypothetical protein CC86DRAFT_370399 [Ophiobolus disseminans]